MSDLALSIIAAGLVLACLCTVIIVTVAGLRRADAQVKMLFKAPTPVLGTSITTDEIIDLHLALNKINSLREISERIPA